MKTKLLKRIRSEYHIKHVEYSPGKKETQLFSKDFKYAFSICRIMPNWIFFCQCYLLLSMNKYIEIRKVRTNKNMFRHNKLTTNINTHKG